MQTGQTTWSDDDLRPRVLLECHDGGINWAAARALERHGYAVATCEGPEAMGGCSLVREGRCELMADADVVVHALNQDHPDNAEILDAARRRFPSTPIVVELTRPQAERDAERLAGTERIRYPMTRQTLLATVARVLDTEMR